MGLDLDLRSDKEGEIKTDEYLSKYLFEHSLSRTFVSMLDIDDIEDGVPELHQVGKCIKVDTSAIFQMANYINRELDFVLDGTESIEERHRILYTESPLKGNLKGNIDKVLRTVNELIDKASKIDNLPSLLDDHGYDTLHSKNYFSDFNVEVDDYIDNNFGQDLRNLKKGVEYAKDKGATTVYFGFD